MDAHRTADPGHIRARNRKARRSALQQRVRSRLAPRAQHSHIARGKHSRDRVDVSEEANAPSELKIERECFRLILGPRRAARE